MPSFRVGKTRRTAEDSGIGWKVMVVSGMKGSSLYDRRLSDKGIFWSAVTAVITLAHVHLYLVVGVHLTGLFEAFWVAVGIIALLSSYAASRIDYRRCLAWKMFIRLFLQRWGACWNIFVFLASALMFASRLIPDFYEITVPLRFAFSCGISFFICLYGLVEGGMVRVVHIEIPTRKLQGNGKFRILQLSDMHIGPFTYASFVKKVIKKALKERPDITVVTGDIVDGRVGDERGTFPFYVRFAEPIRELARKSRLGAWAIPGNHDYYEGFGNSMDFIRKSGITMLRTRKTDLGRVVLAGADDLDHETNSGTAGHVQIGGTDGVPD